VIDILSNIIVVKTLMDIVGYFSEWKELVRIIIPHLIENRLAFEEYFTAIELMEGMNTHRTHKWFEYLFLLKYLKIFRFTRWLAMVQNGVSEAMESPSLKNVKNNIINLINLTEIMIMIITAVSFNMCVWARNSSYLYH
jgi:hypothetical protein